MCPFLYLNFAKIKIQPAVHYCAILNQETVSGSQFYAEYIYNAFALIQPVCFLVQLNIKC